MDIKDLIQSPIKYDIGDERNTFTWYDNWSGLGPLINNITHRRLYDARVYANGCAADMIEIRVWRWPIEWYDTLPMISNIAVPMLFQNRGDEVTWVGNDGSRKNFFLRNVYKD
ncbi:hypothetical protein Tco_1305712 [Tanacetum coccineum]